MKRNLLGQPLTTEEAITLKEMSKHHPFPDFRRRALALPLALNDGATVVQITQMFRISDQPIYNWTKGWRTKGLVGILTGHKGGRPPKLTAEMLDVAADIARSEPLTLARIAARVREQYPDAPSFSLDRLSVGLRTRKLSFKRTRLSLEKKETKQPSRTPKAAWQDSEGRPEQTK
ncbi:transposase [Oceanisphaera litoralis]|uniref:helix-turn-helix domain-containing protein n=1 Tax=Oceanisphaera litoralis TaxID=225144 RepID=UPI0019581A72|nr:helix-turn-helix domain-containing protein [Oceanisphaera litoralis]MBM7456907.1 transposase [Oceanisphaera litoralis]